MLWRSIALIGDLDHCRVSRDCQGLRIWCRCFLQWIGTIGPSARESLRQWIGRAFLGTAWWRTSSREGSDATRLLLIPLSPFDLRFQFSPPRSLVMLGSSGSVQFFFPWVSLFAPRVWSIYIVLIYSFDCAMKLDIRVYIEGSVIVISGLDSWLFCVLLDPSTWALG